MDRLMSRLDILEENIDRFKKKSASFEGEQLLDNQDLLQLLKISSRTLQRYRSEGKLKYYTITGKIYYKQSDLEEFVQDSFNDSRHLKRGKTNRKSHF